MTGTTHTSIQPRQDKFDTNGVSIVIDNWCSGIMSYFKQDFVDPLKKGWRVINGFEGTKVHTIYEGTINWTINDDFVNPHQIEIPNSLYVSKGRKRLISLQHWAQNSTSTNAYVTTLNVTCCVTHHDCATLIWGGGDFFALCLLTRKMFSLYILQLATLCSLNIVMLLVMIHIYMMIRLTVSLKTLLFSVSLRSLTSQCHSLFIYLCLHSEKPNLQREGFKTQR